MAIATNDAIVKLGTRKVLESSGGSIANNAITQATTAYVRSSDGSDAKDAVFDLACAFTTAPTVNTTLDLYAQEINVDGSSHDEVAPTATYKWKYITSFVVQNTGSSTVQYLKSRPVKDIPANAKYSIYNNGTGQTVNSTWVLGITPRTIGPSP